MQKFKQYWVIILVVVLIIGASFYWFQYRPYKARKGCIKYTKETMKAQGSARIEVYNFIYNLCLRERGME